MAQGGQEGSGSVKPRYDTHTEIQHKKLLKEQLRKFKGESGSDEEELWPSRPVDIDREFPQTFDQPIDLRQEMEKKPFSKPLPAHIDEIEVVNQSMLKNKVEFVPKQDFESLGVDAPSLLEKLKEIGVSTPTDIQCMVIPQILAGHDVLCAARTGTGKTLAFLIPILQCLKAAESVFGFRRRGQRARAVIFVPTRELVSQHVSVIERCLQAKEYSHMKVEGMSSNSTYKKEWSGVNDGVDFLVTTPERLSFHLDQGHIYLEDTNFLVIDEADSMFHSESFRLQILKMVHLIREAVDSPYKPIGNKQELKIVWASATISESFSNYVSEIHPQTQQVFAPSLHTNVETLKQNFIYGSHGKFKERVLLNVLDRNSGKRTMIFCNSTENAKLVYKFLFGRGFSVCTVASSSHTKTRAAQFQEFTQAKKQILVTTDLASRGIDSHAVVEHVILYDFPTNVVDYIHRVGRTARAGREGLATALVGNADQSLAAQIRNSLEGGQSLAHISPTKKTQKKAKKARVKEREQKERESRGQNTE